MSGTSLAGIHGRKNWWRWRVSNPRPAAYESAALPPELHRHSEESSLTLYHKECPLNNVTASTMVGHVSPSMPCPLHPKHLHHFIAEMVDDLDGDAAGWGVWDSQE